MTEVFMKLILISELEISCYQTVIYFTLIVFRTYLGSTKQYPWHFFCEAVHFCCGYLHFKLLLVIPFALAGHPLPVVCGDQASCCFDTPLSVAASGSNTAMDESDTSACPLLSPAMEAINMEVSIIEHYAP
jgi:hypothetical protein